MDNLLIDESGKLAAELDEVAEMLEDVAVNDDTDWANPVNLDAPNMPTMPARPLPSWAGEFVAALAISTETPTELSTALTLACVATVCAKRFVIRVKPDYFEPLNIWPLAALAPGNRKSAVLNACTAPLLDWEREQATLLEPANRQAQNRRKVEEDRLKELQAKAAKAKDANERDKLLREMTGIQDGLPEIQTPPQLWSSDVTPERLGSLMAEHGERMAWLSAEGGIFDIIAGRYSGGIPNLDLFLKAHAGDPERVDRGSRPPVFLRHPALTIGISPQPELLQGLTQKPGFRGRGLLGRFLYFLPDSPLGFRTGEPPSMPEPIQRAYHAGLRAILDQAPAMNDAGQEIPHTLRLSPSAYREWLDFWQVVEVGMRPGGDFELMTDWAGKLPGAVARLAGLFHVIEHAHSEPGRHEVSLTTMQSALELAAILTRHALAAFDLMGADPAIDGARRIWRWIERNRQPVFSKRDCHQANKGRFKRAADLDGPLSVLMERHYIRPLERETQGPGRPTEQFMVNPQLTGEWA